MPKTALPFEEEIPPAGADNLMFSDAEIRHCLAQIIRIEAIRSLVNRYEKAQVEYFNGLVADYNNRCGHYRYVEGARESAQALVEASRPTIESDARAAYLWRFIGAEKSAVPSRSPANAATAPQGARKQSRPPTAPESRSAQADRSAPVTAQLEAKQQSPSTTAPVPEAPPSQADRAAPATPQPEAKLQVPSATAAVPEPRPSQADHSALATPQPEAQQQSASPTALGSETRAPQPDRSAPAIPQGGAKQQPPSATAAVPETRPSQADRSAPATPQPEATRRSESLTAPMPETSAARPSRSAGLTGQSGPPQRPPTSTAAAPDTPSSQAERTAAVTPQAEVKQQPQPQSAVALAPPPGRSDRSANGTSPPMPKPPSLAKAPAETGAGAVMERFAHDVQQVGSQVLDQRDYPSEARDKKWEGTTQIEVRYAEGGYIRSIVVAESSGYPALDETAVQIARNIRLPNAPEELRSRDFAVRFPIVFRLRKP